MAASRWARMEQIRRLPGRRAPSEGSQAGRGQQGEDQHQHPRLVHLGDLEALAQVPGLWETAHTGVGKEQGWCPLCPAARNSPNQPQASPGHCGGVQQAALQGQGQSSARVPKAA